VKRILVVDDEPQLRRALDINLRARHYAVVTVPTGALALRMVAQRAPDAIVLDLGLPDMDGVDVIHGLRAWSAVPVIVLSGRTGIAERVEALDAGADDYLTKPFAMEELAARLRVVLRRPNPADTPGRVDLGSYTVDLAAYTVSRRPGAEDPGAAEEVHLTPTEWRLLTVLLRNPERLVTGRQLLAEVWGRSFEKRTNYLRVYMAGLRRKLESDPARPRHIITEPGMGYRFQP
jgi:two-component system, OmpR family, KDP operon response regulator KdpE